MIPQTIKSSKSSKSKSRCKTRKQNILTSGGGNKWSIYL